MHVERIGSVLFCAACSFVAADQSLDNSQCRLLTKWRTAWSSLIHKWRDELTCIKSEKSSGIYTSMLGQGWRVYTCWGVTGHLHFWQNDNVEYTPPWILQLSWSLQWRERAGMISTRLWVKLHLHHRLSLERCRSRVQSTVAGHSNTAIMMPLVWLWCHSSVWWL